jgi:type IV fimbrial biogenesis protein FimT
MLSNQNQQGGFSLIELLIGFAVIGILTVIAIPAFQQWLRNAEIRNAAEAIANGIQIARAEAISRNVTVQMVIGPGTGWTVSEVVTGTQIQQRSTLEGAGGAALIINDLDADGVSDDPDADRLTFSGMGWRVANGDGSPLVRRTDFNNPLGGSCKHIDGGSMRCMRVVIAASGASRMCDPAVAAGDPRACL